MNARPRQDLPLDEFLVAVNAADLQGNFVVPGPDVAGKLAMEIEQRTGIKATNLACEGGVLTSDRWVSAKPGEFVTQTRVAVDGICALLHTDRASTFEVGFHNTRQGPNESGDRVWLGLRYTRAT